MKRQLLKITPMGELFFRDGTTMEKGTNNWIVSKAIPNLSVFYGALTSLQLRSGKFSDILELIKELSNTEKQEEKIKIQNKIDIKLREKIKIYGVYLTSEKDLYMSAPLDLFYNEKGEIKKGEYKNGLIYPPEIEKNDEVWERADDKFIKVFDYKEKYIKNDLEHIEVYDNNMFFSYYHKVGLTIGDNRVNEEGSLYFADMITFTKKDVGYILDVEWQDEAPNFTKEKMILLGGEKKTALIEELSEDNEEYKQWGALTRQVAKSQIDEFVKIVFTAPFLLPEGSNDIIDDDAIEVIAASMKKIEYIGSYNMTIEKQRKMRITIPAGSVFLLKIKKKEQIQGAIQDYIKRKLNQKETDKEFVSFLVI